MACIRKTTAFAVLLLAVYTALCQVEAFGGCRRDSDCSYSKYCCKRSYVCRYNCVDESCIFHRDCAPGESCCGSDDKSCATTCIGKSCTLNNHCATGESCCDSDDRCATTCIGKSCTFDNDCATGECCDSDGKCKTDNCDLLAGWIIAVIVIGIIVVVVIPLAVFVFCRFCDAGGAASWRRPARGGVIVTQPATTGTTVVATQQQHPVQQGQPMYFQNPQPYPNQPPPYQPAPYQPPPYQPAPYQPQGTVYPPGASGPPVGMAPQPAI